MTDHITELAAAADNLEKAREARDVAIIDAHRAKLKITHIAAAVRLSRAQVHRIIKMPSQR